jgi:FAD/FMN-containing dehydrogenase
VHGRYVGRGPIISSVKALKVVLADGSEINASPETNGEIFNGVIGGYGGLGMITEATLELVENVRVKRQDRTVPIASYKRYFVEQVQALPAAVLHNGDIYPPAYDTVHAVTYAKTDEPVTVADRLVPWDATYGLNRFVYWVVSEWPLGKMLRERALDPLLYRDDPVTWLNYEASYDARELEPASRGATTYVLMECFVPGDQFDAFIPRLRDVLQRNDVNVINVSIRHARQDPGSILAWAKTDVFAFVIYYKQGTSAEAIARTGSWTRELIDAALSFGGSYYLPYQLHATTEQFFRAYPLAPQFFALKRRLDPTNKFRNALWMKYGPNSHFREMSNRVAR